MTVEKKKLLVTIAVFKDLFTHHFTQQARCRKHKNDGLILLSSSILALSGWNKAQRLRIMDCIGYSGSLCQSFGVLGD